MKQEESQQQKLHFASKTVSLMAYCPINQFIMDIMLPLKLLQILACPVCKGELTQPDEGSTLHCQSCNRDYPVVEDIPMLLPDLHQFTD